MRDWFRDQSLWPGPVALRQPVVRCTLLQVLMSLAHIDSSASLEKERKSGSPKPHIR